MSITAGLPRIQEKASHRFHQRHNSGELDVFEAAGYFSGSNDINGAGFTAQPKIMRASGRMSLDIPVMSSKRSSVPAPSHHQKVIKDEKKFKQPNSPSGKLASFLNSLFNQTSSKTKKSKMSSSQSMKDDQDHEIWRRKRRSSMSQFQSVNTSSSNCNSSDSKSSSFYSSSSSSEKRPPYAKAPTRISSKEIQSHPDKNQDVMINTSSKTKNNITVHIKSSSSHKKIHNDDLNMENSWLDEEKFRFRTPNYETSSEKYENTFTNGVSGDKINHSKDSTDFKNFMNDEDDGADSDSSSDLFELQNYDLVSCYSSDLPVYETTHIDAIKRVAPIVSRAM